MDLSLSRNGMEGVEAARVIRRQTDAKVLILSGYEDPEIVLGASRRAFASGYIMKSQFFMMVPTIQHDHAGTDTAVAYDPRGADAAAFGSGAVCLPADAGGGCASALF